MTLTAGIPQLGFFFLSSTYEEKWEFHPPLPQIVVPNNSLFLFMPRSKIFPKCALLCFSFSVTYTFYTHISKTRYKLQSIFLLPFKIALQSSFLLPNAIFFYCRFGNPAELGFCLLTGVYRGPRIPSLQKILPPSLP